jgi:hypothetical protein
MVWRPQPALIYSMSGTCALDMKPGSRTLIARTWRQPDHQQGIGDVELQTKDVLGLSCLATLILIQEGHNKCGSKWHYQYCRYRDQGSIATCIAENSVISCDFSIRSHRSGAWSSCEIFADFSIPMDSSSKHEKTVLTSIMGEYKRGIGIIWAPIWIRLGLGFNISAPLLPLVILQSS